MENDAENVNNFLFLQVVHIIGNEARAQNLHDLTGKKDFPEATKLPPYKGNREHPLFWGGGGSKRNIH